MLKPLAASLVTAPRPKAPAGEWRHHRAADVAIGLTRRRGTEQQQRTKAAMPDDDEAPDRHAMPDGQESNWPLLIGSYVAILMILAAVGFLVVTV